MVLLVLYYNLSINFIGQRVIARGDHESLTALARRHATAIVEDPTLHDGPASAYDACYVLVTPEEYALLQRVGLDAWTKERSGIPVDHMPYFYLGAITGISTGTWRLSNAWA